MPPGHDDHAVGVADDPVAGLDRRAAALDRHADRAGLVLVAPRRAIIEENTGNPWPWISAMSRTPPSITRPESPRLRAGGEHLTPVAELAEVADVHDERVALGARPRPRRGSPRLSPGVQCTGKAGAATTAPGHAAWIPAAP